MSINIEEMKIGDLIELVSALQGGGKTQCPHIGKKCLIRTYASGVHYGILAAQNGRQIEIKNARRIYRWHAIGGISLSEVAINGIDEFDDGSSRVCCVVPEMTLLDGLEIIPVSEDAARIIDSAPVYKP